MKRLSAILFLSLLFSLSVAVPSSMAVGLGFYYTSGWGEAVYDAEDDADNTWDFDVDLERRGYGLVFDTTVAKDRLVNFRLNLGNYNWEEADESGNHIDLDGFQAVADLGFGLVRNQHLRLWLGVELAGSYGDGSLEENDAYEVTMINVGAGPVLGTNFHMGDRISFGVKVGWLYERFIGEGENTITDTTVDYVGYTTQYFVTLSVFYRFAGVF
jgi:hypothetical protein